LPVARGVLNHQYPLALHSPAMLGRPRGPAQQLGYEPLHPLQEVNDVEVIDQGVGHLDQ